MDVTQLGDEDLSLSRRQLLILLALGRGSGQGHALLVHVARGHQVQPAPQQRNDYLPMSQLQINELTL